MRNTLRPALIVSQGCNRANGERDNRPERVNAWLYIFVAPHGCKIGITKQGVGLRKAELERSCGFTLELSGSWGFADRNSAWVLEQWVHHALRDRRLLGEWFAVTADEARDVVDYCRQHAPQDVSPRVAAWFEGGV